MLRRTWRSVVTSRVLVASSRRMAPAMVPSLILPNKVSSDRNAEFLFCSSWDCCAAIGFLSCLQEMCYGRNSLLPCVYILLSACVRCNISREVHSIAVSDASPTSQKGFMQAGIPPKCCQQKLLYRVVLK